MLTNALWKHTHVTSMRDATTLRENLNATVFRDLRGMDSGVRVSVNKSSEFKFCTN